MKKAFILIFTLLMSVSSFALVPISGTTTICSGSTTHLYSSGGLSGIWSSSNTAVATIGSSSGIATGISIGTSTITYSDSSTYVITTLTVSGVPPAAITGATSFCAGTSITLSDPTPGGVWVSSVPYTATVGSTTGIVTGYGSYGGAIPIYYRIGICYATTTVTVLPLPDVNIKGPTMVCAGSSITLIDSAGYTGTWASSNTSIATVAGGIVSGLTAGIVVISFSATNACGTNTDTFSVAVLTTTPTPPAIGGTFTDMEGGTKYVYNTMTGGTWSSSNTLVVTISGGMVTAIAAGTTTLSYTVSGCSGPVSVTRVFTVIPFTGISGHVLFTGPTVSAWAKVWLITYNPTTFDLEAIDSVSYAPVTGGSAFYRFPGVASDSFRIKAIGSDSIVGGAGYLPTYHTSSYYWNTANVLNHTSGTADINQDINMMYGTVTAGPGFIGGNVYSGANKGTSGEAPVVGMHIYAVNSTGIVVQQAKTDALGAYSFSNLPYDTYSIFPESINYLTTPCSVTISPSATSVTSAGFMQHTLSHTITPVAAAVIGPKTKVASVIVFPNPSNGNINLLWNETATEKGNISITDITGRELYNSTINMTQGTGSKQIDMSNLANGTYMISVNAGSINYNNKIQIAH